MTAVAADLERKYEHTGFPQLVLLVNPGPRASTGKCLPLNSVPQTLSTSLLLAWDD